MTFGFDHIDEDAARYAEPDPDALRDLRDEQRMEAEVLDRHLAGGLTGDAELEEQRALLGQIPPLDGPDYCCGAALAADRKSSPDLGNREEDSRG